MRPATILNHPVPEYNGVRVMIGDPFKQGDVIPSLPSDPMEYVYEDDGVVSYLCDTAFFHTSTVTGDTAMLYMVEHDWLVKPKRVVEVENKVLCSVDV